MKKMLIVAGFLALSASPVFAQYQQPTMGGMFGNSGSNPNSHYVSPYTNNSGTYVQPHMQTNPDSTQRNNYGSQGNYNPYTGHTGTRQPRY